MNLRKTLAGGISLFLFLSNCVLAHAFESNVWAERRKQNPLLMASLPAPTATHPFTAPNSSSALLDSLQLSPANAHKKIVIHIQDVHRNLEAQENIGAIVRDLISKKQVDLIALEGAFEPIELERFRTFPQPDVIRSVSDYLLKQNRISGPIHTALTDETPLPIIIGVDDRTHYQANVQAYKDAVPLAVQNKQRLKQRAQQLQREKTKVFNPELLAFDQAVEQYRSEKLPLSDYLQRLQKAVGHAPAMARSFLEALVIEDHLDFAQAEKERTQILAQLALRLTKAESDQLLQQSLAFKTGALRQSPFYSYLSSLCSDKGISLNSTPAFNHYHRYIHLADTIDGAALFREIQSMETNAFDLLAKTAEERELIQESKNLYLVGKLLDFSLSAEEWREYKETPPSPPIAKHGGEFLPTSFSGEVRRGMDLSAFERFYREAEARDHAMSANVLRAMEKNHASVAVLVTGGFHVNGMNQALKDVGVETVSYTPKITKVDTLSGGSYLTAFTQEHAPLEKLFEGEKLFLAFPPAAGTQELPLLASALTSHPQDTLKALDPESSLRIEPTNDANTVVVTNLATNVRERLSLRVRAGEILDVAVQVLKGERKFQIPFLVHILETLTTAGTRAFAGVHFERRGWLTQPLLMTGKARLTDSDWDKLIAEGLFTEKDIQIALSVSGQNLENFKEKALNGGWLHYFVDLKKLRTKAQVESAVQDLIPVAAEYFPLAYNAVRKYYTVHEFLTFILGSTGEFNRGRSLFTWWPLIASAIKNEKLTEDPTGQIDYVFSLSGLIHRLKEVEKSKDPLQHQFYESLALFTPIWMNTISKSYSEDLNDEILRRNKDYASFHFLPWDQIPNSYKKARAHRRHRIRKAETTNIIKPVPFQDYYAGSCEKLSQGHWYTLMNVPTDPDLKELYKIKHAYGRVIIIRVNGKAIFSMKLIGDKSMVALRTTRTSAGTLATIQGVAYTPSRQLMDRIFKSKHTELFSTFDYDDEEPMEIYPIGWVDRTVEVWDGSRFRDFRRRLTQLAHQYSAPDTTRKKLSLLQPLAEKLIQKKGWTGWKANVVTQGTAFVASPLWEEAVFRTLMLGYWEWNVFAVGVLFWLLHPFVAIVFFKQRPSFSNVLLQGFGTFLITVAYINFHNYFAAVLAHTYFNWAVSAFGHPGALLKLDRRFNGLQVEGQEPLTHPEREQNISILAAQLKKDPAVIAPAYDAMVLDIVRHTQHRKDLFPPGFSEIKLIFYPNKVSELNIILGDETPHPDSSPVEVRLFSDHLIVHQPGEKDLEFKLININGEYQVVVENELLSVDTFLTKRLRLKMKDSFWDAWDFLETGGVFLGTNGPLEGVRTGRVLNVTYTSSGEISNTGIPPNDDLPLEKIAFGYHFHPGGNGAMSYEDIEELEERRVQIQGPTAEVIFTTPIKSFNESPYTIEYPHFLLPISLPGSDRKILGHLYLFDAGEYEFVPLISLVSFLKGFLDRNPVEIKSQATLDYMAAQLLTPMKDLDREDAESLWKKLQDSFPGENKVARVWNELGYYNDFRRLFPNDADFWESPLSFYEVYHQLKGNPPTDGLPPPQSLDLKGFLVPDAQKAAANKLMRAWDEVQKNHRSIRDAINGADAFSLAQHHVAVLPADQDTAEVRRHLATLATGNSKLFIVVEGKDVAVREGKVYASDIDRALQTSGEWRELGAASVDVIKPSSLEWVADLKNDSPLGRVQQILILEDLLKVLSFLSSRQPTVDMLLKAAEAVSKSA